MLGKVTSNKASASRRLSSAFPLLLLALLFDHNAQSQTNVITTVAGRGVVGASLALATGVAVDAAGNFYTVDTGSCVIWKISNGTASAFDETQGSDESDGLSK